MNVAQSLVDRVKFEIPREILIEAFMSRRYDPTRREWNRYNQVGINIDQQIRSMVIDGRVMVDINMCSGVEVDINLSVHEKEIIDPYTIIYRVRPEQVDNREITAVYSVTYGVGSQLTGRGIGDYCGSSVMGDVAGGILAVHQGFPRVSSGKVQLIAKNTVLLSDTMAIPSALWLRCQVTHEPNFANIQPAYAHVLMELVVLATKAYIYNQLQIYMEEGMISSGVIVGRFREIVDSYADAAQMYKEFLQSDWRVSATMNDTEKYRRIMQLVVGGRR